jgi:hypothetical protein
MGEKIQMSMIDWFVDVIEGFFIQSDLYDVDMSEAELCERASLDSLCEKFASNYTEDDTPIGKKVI